MFVLRKLKNGVEEEQQPNSNADGARKGWIKVLRDYIPLSSDSNDADASKIANKEGSSVPESRNAPKSGDTEQSEASINRIVQAVSSVIQRLDRPAGKVPERENESTSPMDVKNEDSAETSSLDMLDPQISKTLDIAAIQAKCEQTKEDINNRNMLLTLMIDRIGENIPFTLPLALFATCSQDSKDDYLFPSQKYSDFVNRHSLGPYTDAAPTWNSSHSIPTPATASAITYPTHVSKHLSEGNSIVMQLSDPKAVPSGLLYAPGFVRQPQVYAAILRKATQEREKRPIVSGKEPLTSPHPVAQTKQSPLVTNIEPLSANQPLSLNTSPSEHSDEPPVPGLNMDPQSRKDQSFFDTWETALLLARFAQIEAILSADASRLRYEAVEKRRRRLEWEQLEKQADIKTEAKAASPLILKTDAVGSKSETAKDVGSYDPFVLIPNAIFSTLRALNIIKPMNEPSQTSSIKEGRKSILDKPDPLPSQDSRREGLSRTDDPLSHHFSPEGGVEPEGEFDDSQNQLEFNDIMGDKCLGEESSSFTSAHWGRMQYHLEFPDKSPLEIQKDVASDLTRNSTALPFWRRIRRVAIMGTHGWKPFIGITSDTTGHPISTQLCELSLGGLKVTLLNSLLLDASESAAKDYRARRLAAENANNVTEGGDVRTTHSLPRINFASADEVLQLIPTPDNVLDILGIEVRMIPIAGFGRVKPRVQAALEMLAQQGQAISSDVKLKAETQTVVTPVSVKVDPIKSTQKGTINERSESSQPPELSMKPKLPDTQEMGGIETNDFHNPYSQKDAHFTSISVSHAEALSRSDLILANAHSQGCVVMTKILFELIQKKIVNPKVQRVSLTVVAGIHHGPFPNLPTDLLSTTKELFLYGRLDKSQFQQHLQAVAYLLSFGVRILSVGAWADAVVPLYSSTLQCIGPHPNLLRALAVESNDMPVRAQSSQASSVTPPQQQAKNSTLSITENREALEESYDSNRDKNRTQVAVCKSSGIKMDSQAMSSLHQEDSLRPSIDDTTILADGDSDIGDFEDMGMQAKRNRNVPVKDSSQAQEAHRKLAYFTKSTPVPRLIQSIHGSVLLPNIARAIPFPFPLLLAALRISSEIWNTKNSSFLSQAALEVFQKQSSQAAEFLMLASTLARPSILTNTTHSRVKEYLSVYILASEWALAGDPPVEPPHLAKPVIPISQNQTPMSTKTDGIFTGALSWLSGSSNADEVSTVKDIKIHARVFSAIGLVFCDSTQLSLAIGRVLEDVDRRSRVRRLLGLDPLLRTSRSPKVILPKSMQGPFVHAHAHDILTKAENVLDLVESQKLPLPEACGKHSHAQSTYSHSSQVNEPPRQAADSQEWSAKLHICTQYGSRIIESCLSSFGDGIHQKDGVPYAHGNPLVDWLLACSALELEKLIQIAGNAVIREYVEHHTDSDYNAQMSELISKIAMLAYDSLLTQGKKDFPGIAELDKNTAALAAIRFDSLDNADLQRMKFEFIRDFDVKDKNTTDTSDKQNDHIPTGSFSDELRDATLIALRHYATESLRDYEARASLAASQL